MTPEEICKFNKKYRAKTVDRYDTNKYGIVKKKKVYKKKQ